MSYAEHSVEGVAILLWAADPTAPERLATPFFHATAAAAMDAQVEMYFSAASVRLLLPQVASQLRASPHSSKTIADNLREAQDFGVRFFACGDALKAQGIDPADVLPGCHRGGAVQFMARAMDLRWRALVF